MTDPLETAELLAFARTVEMQSLSRAARELGVPRATISRRLARLEQRLRVRLLKRTTRRLAVTDAGEALYIHAQRVLAAVAEAESSIRPRDGVVRGDLRVSLPPFNGAGVEAMVTEFATRFPEVRLSLHLSSAHVDLVGAGYDVALRATSRLEPGLIAKTLLRTRVVCVASPRYLEQHGLPRAVGDLRKHRCLMGFAKGEIPDTDWPIVGGGRARVPGVFFSNEPIMLAAVARAGLGIALLPAMIVADDVARGALVPVLEDVIGAETTLSVVYAEREFLPAHVRAFVDHLTTWGPRLIAARGAAAEATAPRRPRTKR